MNHWSQLRFRSLISSMIFFGVVVTSWGAVRSLEQFLTSPSWESWTAFPKDVRLGRYQSQNTMFSKLFEYHDAREKRDLPNSIALKNTTPNQFVSMQVKRTNEALAYLRKNNDAEFWRVLERLAIQEFDESLMWTALEITVRLSPQRFDAMAAALHAQNGDRSRIIDTVRAKWLRH